MTYYTKRNRIRRGSTQSHPKGQFGSTEKKNPFRGIACGSQPHWSNTMASGQRLFRHIEGARDHRRTWRESNRTQSLRATHRDSNPIPCVFLP